MTKNLALPIYDIRKWNYETRQYEPYTVPEHIPLLLVCDDMDKKTYCADCFTPMTFGQGFTSRTLHNHMGLAYSVCNNCHERELTAEMRYKRK